MSYEIGKEDLLRLYDSYVKEERFFLEAHQKRVSFYFSLVSAVFVATIAGGMNAEESIDYLLLLAGPFLVVSLSHLGKTGTFRFYQRFLEAVASKSKIEQKLGYATAGDQGNKESDYWNNECIISTRHVKNRNKYNTSQEFIAAHMRKGYQKPTLLLFSVYKLVAILIALVFIFKAYKP